MKNKKNISFAISAFFLALCIILVWINNPIQANKPTTITFWHAMTGRNGETLSQLINKFNQSHPDIEVKEKFIGSQDQQLGNDYHALYSEILKSLDQRNPPDMAQVYENWTTQLIETNSIIPVETFIKNTSDFTENDLKDIHPVFLKANTFKDRLWTLPFNKSIYVLYYNEDEFKNKGGTLPQNWQQFKELCQNLTQKENGKTTIYALTIKPNVDILGHWIYSHGKEFIQNDTAVFNDNTAAEGLMFWADLVKGDFACISFAPMEDFLNKGAFMYIGTTSSFANLKKKASFNFKIADLPEGTVKRYQFAGTNLAIFANSSRVKQEACWKFICWLLRSDNASFWALNTGYLPVRQSSLATKEFQGFLEENPDYGQVIQTLKFTEVQPKVSAWESIRGFIDDAVYNCLSGKETPVSALNKAVALANKILK